MCSHHPYQDCTSWVSATFGTKQPSSGKFFNSKIIQHVQYKIYCPDVHKDKKVSDNYHIFLDVSLDG